MRKPGGGTPPTLTSPQSSESRASCFSTAGTFTLSPPLSPRQGESEAAQSCPTLATPWTVAYQAPPSMGFSRQGYGSGLPFSSPGDPPYPGIEPGSPAL